MVEELVEDDFSSTSWLTKAKQLSERVEHHLEEEREYFQIAGKILTEAKNKSLASEYRKYITENRTGCN